MGFPVGHGTLASEQAVESDRKAARVVVVSRGTGFGVAGVTGTIAAALAANSSIFAMRLDPSSPNRAFIDRIRMQWTTIVAFTTPLTAGRRLGLFRGSGAATSGGTAIATAVRKHTAFGATSEFDAANGGDIRIAATAALTVTGITYETDPIALVTASHVGAAGGFFEALLEFSASESSEIVLEPGQLLAIRNPVAMDAAGTWQLSVQVQWREAVAFP